MEYFYTLAKILGTLKIFLIIMFPIFTYYIKPYIKSEENF